MMTPLPPVHAKRTGIVYVVREALVSDNTCLPVAATVDTLNRMQFVER